MSRKTEPRRVCRRLQLLSEMEHHEQRNYQVFLGIHDRAVRLVLESKGQHGSWAQGVTPTKIGCMRRTRDERVKKTKVHSRKRAGISSALVVKMKALER